MSIHSSIAPNLYEAGFQFLKYPLALINWKQQTIDDCNPSFCAVLGLKQSPTRGTTLATIFGLPIPFDLTPLSPGGQLVSPQCIEISYPSAPRGEIALELELTPCPSIHPHLGLLQIRDLTEHYETEARVEAAQERTRFQDDALVEIASDESIHRGDLGEALRTLTSRAAQVMDIDRVSVWQLDPKQNRLTCLCLYDSQLPDFGLGQTLTPLDCPPYFQVLKSSRQLTMEKSLEDLRTRELTLGYLKELGLQATLHSPIRLSGRVIGVLSCEHRKAIASWRPSEQAFVAALGDLAALALSAQQHRLMENQLRHMMKMESVGRLAGGVAHDFNNIIQAIKGYTQILLEDESISESNRVFLDEMKLATEMAIKLTRKLLTMSRKQPMKLAPVSLNNIARDLSGMLSKLLPKEAELALTLEPNLRPNEIDASMIEQVIINLIINARDALPNARGKITLSTRSQTLTSGDSHPTPEAKPGNYIVLSISDNGSGMEEATMLRLFEPFFTTKEEGRGTGLGLSMVYGIVKQHHGWIEVQSQLGLGTVFEVFLPVEQPTSPLKN